VNRDSSYTEYAWFFGLGVVWWVLVGLFHAYDPFRGYLYWWNVNPVSLIALNMIWFGGGIALFRMGAAESGYGNFNIFDRICAIVGVVGFVWFMVNLITYTPKVMIALRNENFYKQVEAPITITDLRVSSYAEAQTNFRTQNPDARFQIGTLTYVRDRWVAEYGPKGLFNLYRFPTQGLYEYDPMASRNPTYVQNPMPFAERGLLGNGLRAQIGQRDPFAYYDKVLYAQDPDFPGQYMAVVSLTKCRGVLTPVPYVSNVVLIHQDGRQEWLTATEASADQRLDGLQLIPEWLEYNRISAYGYTHGVWDALFTHTDQVQVQTSSTNEENGAPFHLRGEDGMYWVTPMSPYNTPSFVGLAWQKSGDINGPIYIWRVPQKQAYPGVDALSATIKNSEGHPSDVKWLINNNGTLSGETEILEMLPVGHNGQLYFVGYAAMGSNPQQTRMFVTIRPTDSVVLKDLFTITEVNNWLQGSYDLPPLTTAVSNQAESTGQLDLSDYSTSELWKLLNQVINEIQNRDLKGGTIGMTSNQMSYQSSAELYKLAGRIVWELIR
jgi:hypothetical protein